MAVKDLSSRLGTTTWVDERSNQAHELAPSLSEKDLRNLEKEVGAVQVHCHTGLLCPRVLSLCTRAACESILHPASPRGVGLLILLPHA